MTFLLCQRKTSRHKNIQNFSDMSEMFLISDIEDDDDVNIDNFNLRFVAKITELSRSYIIWASPIRTDIVNTLTHLRYTTSPRKIMYFMYQHDLYVRHRGLCVCTRTLPSAINNIYASQRPQYVLSCVSCISATYICLLASNAMCRCQFGVCVCVSSRASCISVMYVFACFVYRRDVDVCVPARFSVTPNEPQLSTIDTIVLFGYRRMVLKIFTCLPNSDNYRHSTPLSRNPIMRR
jgi:hypothetical protein